MADVEVAKRCSLEIKLGASMLPAYPVLSGSTTEQFLRDEAQRGLGQRLAQSRAVLSTPANSDGYAERLAGRSLSSPARTRVTGTTPAGKPLTLAIGV